jgi:hypothetical protein
MRQRAAASSGIREALRAILRVQKALMPGGGVGCTDGICRIPHLTGEAKPPPVFDVAETLMGIQRG